MPQRRDEFDADSFRDPELDPLINPLLAANMGRWAEVYFTTPPERREQAIYELLRELKHQIPGNASSQIIESKHSENTKTPSAAEKPALPGLTEAVREVPCGACGESNPAEHRFCGVCGAPLEKTPQNLAPSNLAPSKNAAPSPALVSEEIKTSRGADPDPNGRNSVSIPLTDEVRGTVRATETFPPYSDFRLFAVQPEPPPNRRRFYVSVILTMLVAALLYTFWRKSESFSRASSNLPESAQPAVPEQPKPANAIPQSNSVPNPMPSVSRSSSPASSPVLNNGGATRSKPQPGVSRRAHPVVLASAKSPNVEAGTSGAQEFAMAEGYLKGEGGRSRDSVQGAQWLWKAVGKGNLAATVALSDLYLRGEGVPKSCDQGRLLLEAAARKGEMAAVQRLRHLQAFGCQ